MFPAPEILGIKISWFELITVLSILLSLVFGRWFYRQVPSKPPLAYSLVTIGVLLVLGYFATYLLAFLEGQSYSFVLNDPSFEIKFGQSKKFLGFIFLIYCLVLFDNYLYPINRFNTLGDFMAIVVCFFIILEANACLFDGHGCYGRFTNLPWGMYFLHGSAPTLLPVHPTPIYISLSHLLLFIFLLIAFKKHWIEGRLLLVLLIGTSLFNFLIEFVKDTQPLLIGLNFSQLVYGWIGITSLFILLTSNRLNSEIP
ncbi:MAG: prolipoprotein diacylglyceryl transferase [Chitinophagales bacterium]